MISQQEHLHGEPEYTPRSFYGVVACMRMLDNGEVRLLLDDVCSKTDSWPQEWHSHWPFTQKDFESKSLLACDLSEEQFAHVGRILVARLAALMTNKQQ